MNRDQVGGCPGLGRMVGRHEETPLFSGGAGLVSDGHLLSVPIMTIRFVQMSISGLVLFPDFLRASVI